MPLFNRLLKLNTGNILLEDFFTEIVAHLLEEHQNLLISWFKLIGIAEDSDWLNTSLITQKSYSHPHVDGDKRPDIVVELSNENATGITFIESKVSSREGPGQLSDYAKILNVLTGYQHKSLIYITRDFDPKDSDIVLQDIPNTEVQFIQLRWHQFYQFLSIQTGSELIREIQFFMQEHRMDLRNQFSPTDVSAMQGFPDALKLMEAVMWDEVIQKFEMILRDSKTLRFRKRNAFEELQFHGRYTMLSWMPEGFACILGFFLKPADSSDYPSVRLLLQINPGNSPKRQETIQAFKEIQKLHSWKGIALDDSNFWSGIFLERSLRDFLPHEDHIAAIKQFFLDSLNTVEKFRSEYPYLPWNKTPDSNGETDSEIEE